MTVNLSFSEACERNKEPILEVIKPHLENTKDVLEVGSGTGQHAIYFAQQMPHLTWHTSDQAMYLAEIAALVKNSALINVLPPFELDVTQRFWLSNDVDVEAVYTSNTLHIMSWQQVEAFFNGLSNLLADNAKLFIYGPFKYREKFTSKSNQQFDQLLRQRDPLSGLRDFEQIQLLANKHGLTLVEDVAMPANNQCLVFCLA